ncbi:MULTISPECIES: SDR family oxidoreductase [Paenibacillus]|uniref:SDR family oxidoreductase n=1 Tax=Paenibacillus violae TaxID=3077234 RepID=A0ABU3RGG9_9BACL|nr:MULTISPECIES: SDR family oxidoreductase [Paenibacillus]MDU0203366.1 SDR family oxidoreductase [Paenibacillus sp. PFR10]MEC0270787.1 SDR family oxidoreductase [Paenibacillus anseongense]
MRMTDQIALITGGSTGIGKATAVRFAAEGAKVAITGREKGALQAAAAEIAEQGGQVIWIDGDVQFKADVDRMVDTVLGHWGTIDVLVNNAGICSPASFLEIEEAEWDRHMAINLKGTFLAGQAVATVLAKQAKGGSIINMSSVNGLAAEKDQAHYNATKGGINLLTMSMAIELAPLGIRVNALCPGFIETRLTKPLIDNPAAFGPYLQTIPMGRAGVPEEIADAALFMATNDSRYMTGHCLVVDGGQLIKLS